MLLLHLLFMFRAFGWLLQELLQSQEAMHTPLLFIFQQCMQQLFCYIFHEHFQFDFTVYWKFGKVLISPGIALSLSHVNWTWYSFLKMSSALMEKFGEFTESVKLEMYMTIFESFVSAAVLLE